MADQAARTADVHSGCVLLLDQLRVVLESGDIGSAVAMINGALADWASRDD